MSNIRRRVCFFFFFVLNRLSYTRSENSIVTNMIFMEMTAVIDYTVKDYRSCTDSFKTTKISLHAIKWLKFYSDENTTEIKSKRKKKKKKKGNHFG